MIRENSFEAIYTDIHIHTSERPDSIIKGVKYAENCTCTTLSW